MSLTLGLAAVSFASKISRGVWKFNPLISEFISQKAAVCVEGRRYLFSSDSLGIENHKRQKEVAVDRLGNMKEQFFTRMKDYMATSESNTIFTEDMKSMVYATETDEELDVGVEMMKRFQTQNADLRFSNYFFGPPVMRMLYLLNKQDRAYELFMDKSLSGFFDQVTSYVLLMDMLHENKQYDKVLEIMDITIERQVSMVKFPMDCLTLAAATCFQLNTAESFEKLLTLIRDCGTKNDALSLRTIIYGAMLALSQKKPDVAMELMSLTKLQNRGHVPVAYVNVKALIFAAHGRVEEAIHILRSVIEQDLPDHIKYRGEIFAEVIEAVHDVATQYANKDLQHRLATTIKALQDGGLITQQSFAEYLVRPVVRYNRVQSGYKQRSRPPVAGVQQRPAARLVTVRPTSRPGLLD